MVQPLNAANKILPRPTLIGQQQNLRQNWL